MSERHFDPREQAFCSPDAPEVFGGIVYGSQVWTEDPFDVEEIHPDARASFRRLLDRASSESLPPSGRTLLLLGDGGSGKTHLMRAFRSMAHSNGYGYCAYLQMTSRSDNYARYVLANVIDSLEQPYKPGATLTGAMRLARGLLDSVQTIPSADREQLLRGDLPEDVIVRLVNRVATTAIRYPRFSKLDLDLLRAVLFLLPSDGLIHALALKWLRCEDLSTLDQAVLGELKPRAAPEWPLRTLIGLGRLMSAVQSGAFVLLVDQMEEVIELSEPSGEGTVLRSAVNTLVDVADALPNAIVVLACLSDLFAIGKQHLPGPKLDRLLYDPAPITLTSTRTREQIEAIVSKRLSVLFEPFDLEIDEEDPCAPFSPGDIDKLAGLRARDALTWCREHRERCVVEGHLVPTGERAEPGPEQPPQRPEIPKLSGLWNDALAAWSFRSGLSQESFADLLAFVARSAIRELPDGVSARAEVDGRFLTIDLVPPGGQSDPRIIAVCDASSRGGALERQIEEVVVRCKGKAALFVRSTEFPKDAKTKIAARLADLCKPVGVHRKLVVQNADWRTMDAFRAFCEQHEQQPGFQEWLRADAPLTSLPSVRAILEIEHLLHELARRKPDRSQMPTAPADGRPAEPDFEPGPTLVPDPSAAGRPKLVRIGWTNGIAPMPVEVEPSRFTRHFALLGSTGSGKTTAALSMIEALLARGVPAVLLDRKGDLCRYADPAAYREIDDRTTSVRLKEILHDQIDVQLFTPGAQSGRPLAIGAAPDGMHQLSQADRELLASYASASLAGMMGYKGKSHQQKIAILQKAIEVLGRQSERAPTVPALRTLVEDRDRTLLLEVDGLDDRYYKQLAEDLQTLWLRNRRLLEGEERLDIDALLGKRGAPRTRLSIISTQGLGDDATVDFFVAQLLVAIDRWGTRNPAPDLQALFFFDEADRYLPAGNKSPSTKAPMEHLLKRARSAGVGLMLATQSPGDLDYKCREQIGSWLVGRVTQKTATSKLAPLLEASNVSAERVASLSQGQFLYLVEGEVIPVDVDPNLISTKQIPAQEIVQLAADNLAARSAQSKISSGS